MILVEVKPRFRCPIIIFITFIMYKCPRLRTLVKSEPAVTLYTADIIFILWKPPLYFSLQSHFNLCSVYTRLTYMYMFIQLHSDVLPISQQLKLLLKQILVSEMFCIGHVKEYPTMQWFEIPNKYPVTLSYALIACICLGIPK